VLTIARMSLREVARRRGVVILMIMLPLSFYLVRRDLPGQSIRFLALGIAWAVSTLSLFGACTARLRLSGLTARHLVVGRLMAMLTCGMVLAIGYFAIVVIDQHVQRMWAVGLLLATTVLVAAPIGFLIAAVLSRELEGALALLVVVSTQMLADPAGSIAPWLPFWSTRELATYAIDGTGQDYLARGLLHAALVFAVTLIAATAITAVRLRIARMPEPPSRDAGWVSDPTPTDHGG
jgi:hypothetical protein